MKPRSHLLLLALALCALATRASGQTETQVYSNLANYLFIYVPLGGAADGGSTKLIADDLAYNPINAGQNLSSFQIQVYNAGTVATAVTPTVIFWDSDGTGQGPGTFLGQYVLPLQTVQAGDLPVLTYSVPVMKQFALPSSGKIWAGIYFTGTSGETADQINNLGITFYNPPTAGGSNDLCFFSGHTGPNAASNPPGSLSTSPYGGKPPANFGWSLTATAPGTLTAAYTFSRTSGGGFAPFGGLLQAADGNYYGTTSSGGTNSAGTIFQFTPGGTLNTIYNFSGPDGFNPEATLIQGSDGMLYGVTENGGTNNTGTVFQVTTAGTLHTLHSFGALDQNDDNSDGADLNQALIQGRDGYFYGATNSGGANGEGTVFQVTPAGGFQLIATFPGVPGIAGAGPDGPLTEDNLGNFLGASAGGGTDNQGTIFQLPLGGELTTLDNFPATNPGPAGAIIQGLDGNYYGLSADNDGTAFIATPGANGTVTTLCDFGTDTRGYAPEEGLLLASDGNFYGTAAEDNSDDFGGHGSIYRLTPGVNGTADFELLFDGTNGAQPVSTPIQGSDGNLYGTTDVGPTGVGGVIYRLAVTLPAVVQFNLKENCVLETGGTAMVRVDRVGGTGSLTVSYATSDGSALPDTAALDGTDYQAASGTLTWASGDYLPKFIPIAITDRDVDDGTLHTLTITLTNPLTTPSSTVSLGAQSTSTLTINDSKKLATVTLTATVPNVTEGSGLKGIFTLNLSQAVDRDLVVTFTITGTAIDGTDYQTLNTTKKIKAGKTSKQIKIVPLGDLGGASKKTVVLTLQPGPFYEVGTTGKVKGKIFND